MFKYKHFICKWYVDEKISLKEKRHKQINKKWLNYAVWLKM